MVHCQKALFTSGLREIFNLDLKYFYANKKILLEKTSRFFTASLQNKMIANIGVELEFYLFNSDLSVIKNQKIIEEYILKLKDFLHENSLVYEIEKERGEGQIEVKIAHTNNLKLLCETIEIIKEKSQILAKENNFIACFLAQPVLDDCGSAMQFNFSLSDENGENLFAKNEKLLLNSIAAMLDFIDEMMIFCAPTQDDYLRYNFARNVELNKKGKFTSPTNISFGVNNRTAAIRIPLIKNSQEKRIEFRIASANCDCYLVVASLLLAVLNGIEKNMQPQDSVKVFGNAFDLQYNLKGLVNDFEEAQNLFLKSDLSKILMGL